MKKTILILGYGRMGHAMETLLKKNSEVLIYEKFPQEGFVSADLKESAKIADIILFCLHVSIHQDLLEEILPLIKSDAICLSIAKGLNEEGLTAAQIFDNVLPQGHPRVVLYGPMMAEAIIKGRPAFAEVGCIKDSTFSTITNCYKGSNLYLERSDDMTGISWSVILKNVYALIFGMVDELKLGVNMRGYLASAALRELDSIACSMGGKPNSPYALAGLADLITTATSEDSHHHTVGRMMARGETEGIEGEGIHTLEMVKKFNLLDTGKYPLFKLIDEIVLDPKDIDTKIQNYINEVFL